MMTALIIEDEIPAAEQLRKLLQARDFTILDVKVSVTAAVQWLRTNEHPDVIFMDIQLRDDRSFRIFDQVIVKTPIIFTTAYDEFAIKAFDYNSVAYLLKPIRESELDKAILKFKTSAFVPNYAALSQPATNYKTSFLVSIGATMKKINTADIVCFSSDNNLTFLNTATRQFPLGQSLDKLEAVLDSAEFFRISRKVIINRAFIDKLISNGSLSVIVCNYPEQALRISRSRSKQFMDWYQK